MAILAEDVRELQIVGTNAFADGTGALDLDDHSTQAMPKHSTQQVILKTSLSSQEVFAIPELLTFILSAISPLSTFTTVDSRSYEAEDPRSAAVQVRANSLWSLHHTQRINRLCRDVISSTYSLQQCLFIAPQTTSSRSWTVSPTSTQPILNPVVQTITHWRFSHLSPKQMGGRFSAHMIIERSDYEYLRTLPMIHRSMLLSQPPVAYLTAVVWERVVEPESVEARVPPSLEAFEQVRDDGGLTLGKVLDSIGVIFSEDAALKAIKLSTA